MFFSFIFLSSQFSIDNVLEGEWEITKEIEENSDGFNVWEFYASIEYHKNNETNELQSSMYYNNFKSAYFLDNPEDAILDFFSVKKEENKIVFTSTRKHVGEEFSVEYKEVSNETFDGILFFGEFDKKQISAFIRSNNTGNITYGDMNFVIEKEREIEPAEIPSYMKPKSKQEKEEFIAKSKTISCIDIIKQFAQTYSKYMPIVYTILGILVAEMFIIFAIKCCCKPGKGKQKKSTPKEKND